MKTVKKRKSADPRMTPGLGVSHHAHTNDAIKVA